MALHALLQLQWTPDVLKIEFLETLVFVLFNIDSESISVDDSQRISECLIDLIKSMTWISLDSIQLTFRFRTRVVKIQLSTCRYSYLIKYRSISRNPPNN